MYVMFRHKKRHLEKSTFGIKIVGRFVGRFVFREIVQEDQASNLRRTCMFVRDPFPRFPLIRQFVYVKDITSNWKGGTKGKNGAEICAN